MKKRFIPLLFSIGLYLFSGQAAYASDKNLPASASIAGYEAAGLEFPHTESDVHNYHSSGNTHASPVQKRWPSPGAGLQAQPYELIHDLVVSHHSIEATVYAKRYLDHIYPSHNFW